ncbi:hypothetical protein PC129_g12650 [Phytophthora cactorum]|uniref:Uncharacterized protein n=1 Tax=Phytophthora cactorum TaxID=29920 RepID=A0A329SZE6_9STRA|nr:hypothetical protein GQ600_19529 [Phytophthora cactorum]KAG2780707.1 hypothetical protein Pcac1_g9492 [Phytophthora cactorum]KAG2816022.1 hypothetical protein PC111_g13318 [Phytophthora cactorum]KAG2821444.1 hypothetical protein PC112_g11377 [Phytophthora cactorum]KAG2853784.1 hypothetical protein PC113_g13877 [Phytophthora cactorum]
MSRHSFIKLLAQAQATQDRNSPKINKDPDRQRMCDVLQLQPAGAFLRQAYNLQPLRLHSDPVAVVGSCTDIDEALRLPEDSTVTLNSATSCQMQAPNQQDEPEDFLTSIRRGLDELVAEEDDEDSDDDSDDGSDDEGYYYQASKDNTYYSPDQKLPCDFLLDDALDLSDTSTASSSLTPWAHQDSDDENDNEDVDELIFQLDM